MTPYQIDNKQQDGEDPLPSASSIEIDLPNMAEDNIALTVSTF